MQFVALHHVLDPLGRMICKGNLLRLMVSRDWKMLASVAAPSRTIAYTDGALMHEGGGKYLTRPEIERSSLQNTGLLIGAPRFHYMYPPFVVI